MSAQVIWSHIFLGKQESLTYAAFQVDATGLPE